MTKFSKFVAVMAAVLLATAGSQAVFANCTNFGAGFPIFQCGFKAFFEPVPAGAGNVTGAWWQVGYGNAGIANGFGGGGLEGTGVGPLGTFSGNDSGMWNVVLTDAQSVLPQYAPQIPVGSTCFLDRNSWGQTGVDGCADNPRTAADDDNLLNRYFSYAPDPAYYSTNYLIDYPIGVLLTEDTGQWFSIAFVANRSRGGDPTTRSTNTTEGDFLLSDVANGGANPIDPGRNNIIPWQAVPKQSVDGVTFSDPGDKLNSDRILALSWTPVSVVSDGSVRPSGRPLSNPGNGVGVADQGDLVRYIVEGAPIDGFGNPSGPFVALTTVTGNSTTVTVSPDTAIRLRTAFGKVPQTASTTPANCRQGLCGDLGYDVVSGTTIIAGPLVSEKAIDTVASKNKNTVKVTFRTTSELTVDSIDIIGVSNKGDQTVKTIACKQCNKGIGDVYDVLLTQGDLKGAKKLKVRLNGPNTTSPEFSID